MKYCFEFIITSKICENEVTLLFQNKISVIPISYDIIYLNTYERSILQENNRIELFNTTDPVGNSRYIALGYIRGF